MLKRYIYFNKTFKKGGGRGWIKYPKYMPDVSHKLLER